MDVDGFKICIQVCVWPDLDLEVTLRIDNAYEHFEKTVQKLTKKMENNPQISPSSGVWRLAVCWFKFSESFRKVQ